MSAVGVHCRELFKVHRTARGDAAALQGLTLDAAPGEMLALLGPSGSGKSTLLAILAGLERPSAGTALVAGVDIGRLGSRRRAAARRDLIGLVGQHAERALSPSLSVAEAIALPLRLRGAGAGEAGRTAAGLLERVGLADRAGAGPHELSGGERQRVAVCAAVAHRPPIVLADEPTGELDAAAARDVLGLLGELSREGACVVLVTHDPVGARSADRVVRIRDGRVSSENHDEVVVGRGGWLHVPEHLLDRAGIGGRAHVHVEDAGVVLRPVAGAPDRPRAAERPDRGPLTAHGAGPGRFDVPAAVWGVRKAFGERVVFDGFDAVFAPGVLTALVGRSGSGKSTLLALLAGLERPEAGEVEVAGQALAPRSREELAALRARHIGVVGQDPRLAAFLSATEQVALPLELAGTPPADARAAAVEWLGIVGLGERAGQAVGRLSAGERQRVAIARALAAGRGLLLVDEPTSRLDEAGAAAIAELLRRAAHDHGATVVCATHDPVLAQAADVRIALDSAPT